MGAWMGGWLGRWTKRYESGEEALGLGPLHSVSTRLLPTSQRPQCRMSQRWRATVPPALQPLLPPGPPPRGLLKGQPLHSRDSWTAALELA